MDSASDKQANEHIDSRLRSRYIASAATLVYVMGTVEDDSHGHVVSFLPLVLDSFLGYAIEQVRIIKT